MNPRLMSKRALAKFTLSIPKHKRHLAERHLEWAQKQHDSTGGKNKPVLEYDDDEAGARRSPFGHSGCAFGSRPIPGDEGRLIQSNSKPSCFGPMRK